MTNPDYTALLFIIDQSGSMMTISEDMEGGIATVLKEQAEVGKTTVDVVYFDDQYDYSVIGVPADKARIHIIPRGVTALYDAIVRGVADFGLILAALREEERPGHVIVAVVTDGYENSSRENTAADVQRIITHQRDKYSWDFMFLGANQDAIQTAGGLGIRPQDSFTYTASTAGVWDLSRRWSDHTTAYRSGDRDHNINDD